MQGIPDFFEWIHICLAYDVFKDTYKIYKNGEKVESGSWSENPNVHTGCPKKVCLTFYWLLRASELD